MQNFFDKYNPIFYELNSKTFSMYTKGLFLSNFVHKSVQICVSEHFSFAEITHPPHRCGVKMLMQESPRSLSSAYEKCGKNKSVAFIILFSVFSRNIYIFIKYEVLFNTIVQL